MSYRRAASILALAGPLAQILQLFALPGPKRRGGKESTMAEVERIDVERTRERVKAGEALLVCAYDDEEKCRKLALEGSISLAELEDRDVPKDREIIFYCS